MKILVTGGSGFIGRNVVDDLRGKGHEVLAPSRAELDLLDDCAVECYLRGHRFDAVLHAAGKPGHRNAKDPSGVFYTDTRMYFNIVRNSSYFGRLIITGSGAVYDMRHYLPKMREDYWGEHVPEDEHGFFRYVTAHHLASSPGVVDLRLFGVFGPHEDYAIRFISNAICKTLFDLPITIKQNRRFDYLYIKDLFPVVDHFLSREPLHNEYNVTPDSSVELLELARKVLAVSGKNLPIVVGQEGMGPEYSGDNGRLRREMSDLVFTSLDDAIAELYRWYASRLDRLDRNCLMIDR